jgi:hypothetical protein
MMLNGLYSASNKALPRGKLTDIFSGPEWAYLGEMFPTHIRSKGYSLAMSSLSIANIIYTQAAPTAFA